MDAKDFGQLLKDHPEMLDDTKKFAAILRDVYPSERGNVNLMITAYNAGVVSMLRKSDPDSFLIARIMSVLMDDYVIAEEKARWVAALWINAYFSLFDETLEIETDPSFFKVKATDTGWSIIKYTGSEIARVVIPSKICNRPITKIDDFAFSGCAGLTSIVIPNGITEIGLAAFLGCADLNNVIIPKSVTRIKSKAFEYTPWLKGLGNYAMVNNTLVAYQGSNKDVVIPEGTTVIGDAAFGFHSNLENIVIPESVMRIGVSAFSGCTNLTSITIPQSVTSIGSFAFNDCTNLTSVTIPEGITEIRWGAFKGCTGLTSVTIPESVKGIGGGTFSGCTGLTSVTILEGVWDIEDSAFSGCTSLTSVTIPESVTYIDDDAFSDCPHLVIHAPAGSYAERFSVENGIPFRAVATAPVEKATKAAVPPAQSVSKKTPAPAPVQETDPSHFIIVEQIFLGYIIERYIRPDSGKVIIPQKIKGEPVFEIGNSAFAGCTGLTSVTIPESVTEIKNYTFKGCTGLTSVTIPESVTEIGWGAFKGCIGLTSMTIPKSVTEIGRRTFESCTGLTSATIPESVTKIGDYAFKGCTSLTNVTIPEGVTHIDEEAFSDCPHLTIHAPAGSYAEEFSARHGIPFQAV